MTEHEVDDFIKTLPPPQNYTDVGYDVYLNKNVFGGQFQSAADFNSQVESISLSKVGSGITQSVGRKITIDFDKGQIRINDGSTDRILIGELL